jgi:hypothetical protein
MAKFRVGDEVVITKGSRWYREGVGKVLKVTNNPMPYLVRHADGIELWQCEEDVLPANKSQGPATLPIRFILQYELNTDSFELFTAEKELRVRITELAANPSLRRDSIKVYDIKKVRTVKLGVKITISK